MIKSFYHAINGLLISIKTQRNIRIEIMYLFFIMILSFLLKVEINKILKMMLSAIILIIAELINTSIEFLTDLVVKKNLNKDAKIIKDVSASAVLVALINCIIINIIIFLPYIRTI